MGYLRRHAIVVTAWMDLLEKAHAKAIDIFNQPELLYAKWEVVSDIVEAPINGENSFFIAWDGSKEGWETSELGDQRRAEYVQWLKDQAYEDGSNSYHYVEVQYADEDGDDVVLNSSGLDWIHRDD